MDIFETVKANLDLKMVMESEGIHIGRNHMACCPFHEDKHPSMIVKVNYHCFGCQEHGDVISFIAKRYGLKPIEAAKKLALDYGISINEEPSPFLKAKIQTMKKKKLWHEKKRDLLHRLQKLSTNLNTLTLTGVRVGELCALKWEDITPISIHIHAQQLTRLDADKKNEYYYDPYTKNEKGISQDGRDFPLTKKIHALLEEIKSLQNELGIKSEYIFCHEDGDWIKTDAYETFLRRLCRSKNLNVTNNHALRMSLNSNVLIPKGISVADRVAMLGHSIETNLKYYSFAQKDYLGTVCAILDEDENEGFQVLLAEGTLGSPSKVVNFPKRKASNY